MSDLNETLEKNKMLNKLNLPYTDVSVIIPFYTNDINMVINKINNFKNIKTHANIKLLLINDCSPIEDKNIEYIKNLDNIFILNNELNRERIYCRNIGAEICNSKYIIFNDIDDIINVDMYNILYSYVINNNLDVCYGNCYVKKNNTINKWIIEDELTYPTINFFHICSMIIKTSLFNEVKFIDYFGRNKYNRIWAGEDVNFIMRLLKKIKCIKNCKEYTYTYEYGIGSSHINRVLSRYELFCNYLMANIEINEYQLINIITQFMSTYILEINETNDEYYKKFLDFFEKNNEYLTIKNSKTNCKISPIYFNKLNPDKIKNNNYEMLIKILNDMNDISLTYIKNTRLIFYEKSRLKNWNHYAGWLWICNNINNITCNNDNYNLYIIDYIEKIFCKKHTDINYKYKLKLNNTTYESEGIKIYENKHVSRVNEYYYIDDDKQKKLVNIEADGFNKLPIYINNINCRKYKNRTLINKKIYVCWEKNKFIVINNEELIKNFDILPVDVNYTKPLHDKNFICFWHNPFSNIPTKFQNGMQLDDIIEHTQFKNIMSNNCKAILTFTDDFKYKLDNKLKSLGINKKIYTISHPHPDVIIKFNYDMFVKNKNKKLIFIGFWLRKIDIFMSVNIKNYEKLYIGNAYVEEMEKNNIKCLSNIDNYTYDNLLSHNIVFLDIYDTVINNTFIESIMRQTPILLPKHSSFIEILGNDYPLYFNENENIDDIINNNQLILNAHNYLKQLKYNMSLKYFNNSLKNIINDVILKDTLIIIGNGPSMKQEYFNMFKNTGVDTIAMNSSYKKFKELNFYPTYFCCFDEKLVECHLEKFKNLIEDSPIKQFFILNKLINNEPAFEQEYFEKNKKLQKLNYIEGEWMFYQKSTFDNFYNMHNTGSNACNVGIILGYKRLILIGCDCNYVNLNQVKMLNPNNHLLEYTGNTSEPNPNYWFDNYQEKGELFAIPNHEKYHIQGWKKVSTACKINNIEIINCSNISNIDFFKKSTLENELCL
jgi:hypothetical protein